MFFNDLKIFSLRNTLVLAAAAGALLPSRPGAETLIQAQLVKDIGASERVEAASMLRVLSQEVASAACHLNQGVAPDLSRTLLRDAKHQFTLLLHALEHGNPRLNIIGAEERRKTLAKIHDVHALWIPVFAAKRTLLQEPGNADALAVVRAENARLLAATYDLTSEIAGQYSNPAELLQADVMLVDFAGRQALLIQKMAKLACEIWAGTGSAEERDELRGDMAMYEQTLAALRDGMPAVGLAPAPTPRINDALGHAQVRWNRLKPMLAAAAAAQVPLPKEEWIVLYEGLTAATQAMEKIEKLYVIHSKHSYE